MAVLAAWSNGRSVDYVLQIACTQALPEHRRRFDGFSK